MKESKTINDAVMKSFITEVNALKPGNVSRYSEGHDMTVDDFVKSAELSTPILCDKALSVGQRVLASVEETIAAVGCNTNLGMLLLFAPIVRAAEDGIDKIQNNLARILEELTHQDALDIFKAIQIANPGGLGSAEKYDVQGKIEKNLEVLVAMQEAQERDLIAKQYVTKFNDIFSIGYPCLENFAQRWNSVQWGSVACYMGFLAELQDSHISRKFGSEVAETIRINAVPIKNAFQNYNNPEEAQEMLMRFDRNLKGKNINPGTCADLTAASLLVFHLIKSDL